MCRVYLISNMLLLTRYLAGMAARGLVTMDEFRGHPQDIPDNARIVRMNLYNQGTQCTVLTATDGLFASSQTMCMLT